MHGKGHRAQETPGEVEDNLGAWHEAGSEIDQGVKDAWTRRLWVVTQVQTRRAHQLVGQVKEKT